MALKLNLRDMGEGGRGVHGRRGGRGDAKMQVYEHRGEILADSEGEEGGEVRASRLWYRVAALFEWGCVIRAQSAT